MIYVSKDRTKSTDIDPHSFVSCPQRQSQLGPSAGQAMVLYRLEITMFWLLWTAMWASSSHLSRQAPYELLIISAYQCSVFVEVWLMYL